MKSIVKKFLVSGLILFGLSAFTACSSDVDDTEPEVPVAEASDTPADSGSESVSQVFGEEALDFTQTTITASPYTYPESVDHSVHSSSSGQPSETFVDADFEDSSKPVSSTLIQGTAVSSSNHLITVTPQSNGLKVQVNYNATNASKLWQHVSLKVANLTDNTGAIEVSELGIVSNSSANTKTSEFLYKFTESGMNYKVWLTHMGSAAGEWTDWGTTENTDYVVVTSIGGYGNINSTASDMRIERDSSGNRVVSLNDLVITGPADLFSQESSISQAVKVRAERGTRWAGGECDAGVFFPLTDNHFTIAKWNTDQNASDNYEGNEIDKLKAYINGSQKLFIVLTYRFIYDHKEYKHDIYANYDKWIPDCKETLSVPTSQFPLITITSETGTNYFVTEPVAHHVKDAQRGWNDLSNINTPDPWYEDCSIAVNDVTVGTGKVKVRGNWTTSYDKKSLRIKFENAQNLCGLNDGEVFKNWVLLAVWKDASFLRDAVGLQMFKAMFPDYYAGDCKLVEVKVNNEYMGVYLLTEQQEVKSHRVNITEAKNSTGTDIGYFIEYDSYYTSEAENERFEINYGGVVKDYNGRALQSLQKGYTIKSDINNAAQKDFIMRYMNRLWRICYDAAYNKKYFKFTDNFTLEEYTPEGANDDEKCKNCISQVIDITSLANMYIFNELVCDPDIYLTSFFITADFGAGKDRKLRFQAPWDFDSTMGNKRHCADAQGMFAGKVQRDVNFEAGSEYNANPWMVIFIKQAWFQNLVKTQWAAVNPTSVCSQMISYINANSSAQHTEYAEVFNYTRNKWGIAVDNDELCSASITATAASQSASAEYLKNWLTARFSAVNSIITGLSTN